MLYFNGSLYSIIKYESTYDKWVYEAYTDVWVVWRPNITLTFMPDYEDFFPYQFVCPD